MNRQYLTTAIPYVNAVPHIGFALEIVQADVLARYHRLKGDETYFLTGTDENALKNVQAAEKAGVPVQKYVDENAQKFADLKDLLNLSNNDFIRTTEDRHTRGAQKLWKATAKDIYKKTYTGLYCVGCEAFYTPEELDEKGECFEHPGKKLEEVSEENYFFKLSNYQDWLTQLIESDELKIVPQTRKNEVLAFIKQGLEDFSISRTKARAKGWGIPVPDDPDQFIYVWYDALANYITALGYADETDLYHKFWLDNPNRLHVIGKGITRFHAIYWPAMLHSAGLPIPTQILVHGYITSGGVKMSKSLGNVIDPFEEVKKYGADAVRYYLLKEIPTLGDGDYTPNRFREVYNADLANTVGNLLSRVSKLLELNSVEVAAGQTLKLSPDVASLIDNFQLDEALGKIVQAAADLNKKLNETEPWKKTGSHSQDLWNELVGGIRQIAVDLQPFLPETAEKITGQFAGPKTSSAEPLFPRLQASGGQARLG